MTPEEQLIERKRPSKTPYQLDPDQTLKAATALFAHIKKEQDRRSRESSKKDLLREAAGSSDEDEEYADEDGEAISLILTTKKFIVDKTRLKPGKILLHHSIYSSQASTVCLFTCDPVTPYRELLQHPSFPASLSQRITETIPIAKLKRDYKPFETRRQLLAQHDLFLADDRAVVYLPTLLGKTFYKCGLKRPIPIRISPRPEQVDGKRVKKDKKHALTPRRARNDRIQMQVATPADAAKEIEKALTSTTVQLSPSTSTSIRIGKYAKGWTPEMVKKNVEVAVEQLIEKYVPGKWRGVRALYVKGLTTASLPIWMAEQLWEKEEDVLERPESNEKDNGDQRKEDEVENGNEFKELENGQNGEEGKKRKASEDEQKEGKRRKKKREVTDDAGSEATSGKRKLEKQKKTAMIEFAA